MSFEFFRVQITPLLVGFLTLAASALLYRKRRGLPVLMMFGCSTFLTLRILVGYVLARSAGDLGALRGIGRFLAQHADLAYLGFCVGLFLYAVGERTTRVNEDPAPSSSAEVLAEKVPDVPPPE